MGIASRPLPNEFPVFPLPGAVLLPGARLPLNIFEPRYLAMIEDALGNGRLVGMIQPDETRMPTPSGPGLYKVGCLGRIDSFSQSDDGRLLITLNGLIRFVTNVELEMRRGYRRVRADSTRYSHDLEADTASDITGVNRDSLIDALRAFFTAHGLDANWDAINEMADSALVSTLSMVCPFEPAEKQVLLEAETPVLRSKALLALLQIGAHLSDAGDASRTYS